MKKLKLNIEDLTVTSMETHATHASGTVYAASDWCSPETYSCPPMHCVPLPSNRIDC